MKRIQAILFALVVSATLWSASYVQLVSTDQLKAGDTLVWVNKANLKGNTTVYTNNKYMQVTGIQLVGTDTVVSADLSPMVLGGSEGAWTFTYTNGKKIGRVDNSTNFSTTANLTYTISFTADSNAIICSASASTYRIFYNIQSPRFAFYTSSSMASVQLFKKLPDGQGAAVKVSEVQLDADTLYLRAGEQDVLTATVLPADAKNKEVTWGTLNEGVATVTDGVVSAIAQGETKIWVRTTDGEFTDTCFVKIYASISQPDVTWNQLQCLDSLKEGTRLFFASVKAGENYVMGIYDYDVAKSNIPGAAATFSEDRHQVTASESYAYTVHIDNGKYVFTDLDGSYLCDYGQKNLSAQDNLDNKARWTGALTKDFAFTFTNVYNTGYVIYNNHNNDLFCCYNPYDQSNMSYIAIYSDNAPQWEEPELHPEWTILCNKDTIKDTLDWGKVIYDDTWGTETNPYQESKTLTFVTQDLTEPITLALAKGVDFELYTSSIPAKGGTATINFSVVSVGTYTDTLVITYGDTARKIVLKAQATKAEEILPTLTLSTKAITLNPNTNNNMTADAEMTFSVKNLKKNLYIKWEKGDTPDNIGDNAFGIAGMEAADLYFGSSANMGTADRTNEDILIEVSTYTPGTYTSYLYFYTPDEKDKSKNAFEERVTITVIVKPDYTPTDIHPANALTLPTKFLRNGHLYIRKNNRLYVF